MGKETKYSYIITVSKITMIVVLCLFLVIPSLVSAKTIPLVCLPYLPLIEKYDWNVQTAINVMFAESSCNPIAVNLNDKHRSRQYPRDYPQGYCYGSFGLFQTSCTRLVYFDPALNIALAYEIYKIQGWGAWGSCTSKVVNCII